MKPPEYTDALDEAIRYSDGLIQPVQDNRFTHIAVTAVASILSLFVLYSSYMVIMDGVSADNDAIRTSDYKAVQVASIAGLMVSKYDVDVMVRTVIGEAAREPDTGKIAVTWVILNRAVNNKSWYGGSNVADVALRKSTRALSGGRRITTWQFEPWMHSHTKSYLWSISEESPLYKHVHALVLGCLVGVHADPTNGATHFLNPVVLRARGVALPGWAKGEGRRIGNHVFFQ